MKRQGPSENALLLKEVKEQGLLGCRHHIIVCRRQDFHERLDRLSALLRADNIGHISTHMLRSIQLAKPYDTCMDFAFHEESSDNMRGRMGIVHLLDTDAMTSQQLENWMHIQKMNERYRK